jgi:hypothetical protein
MQLHPQVTEAEVYAWLKAQAEPQASTIDPVALETALKATAEAMAAIGKVVLPDEIEPLFP